MIFSIGDANLDPETKYRSISKIFIQRKIGNRADPVKNYELAILELDRSFDGQMDEKVSLRVVQTLKYVNEQGQNPLSNFF